MRQILTLILLMAFSSTSFSLNIYVEPDGDDTNPGTINKPLRSLQQAQQKLRALPAYPKEGVNIILKPGDHVITETLLLTSRDSGTSEAPLKISSMQDLDASLLGVEMLIVPQRNAHLHGGIKLPADWFEKLAADSKEAVRVKREALPHIFKVDLKAHGIKNIGKLSGRGFANTGKPSPELFFDAKPMQFSRWPNKGYAKISTVDGVSFSCKDAPIKNWSKATNAWAFGYWYHEWADQSVAVAAFNSETDRITLADKPQYGLRKNQRFIMLNLLEELDQPGDWCLDSNNGVLYFWPPEYLEGGEIVYSGLKTPFIKTLDAANVKIENLEISYSRGTAIEISSGKNVVIENCKIENIGLHGIRIKGGKNHSVRNSDLGNLGAGGVIIDGGNRKSLTPAKHSVFNCWIHDFERQLKTYAPGVRANGVGIHIAKNTIFNAPHSAIIFGGNDHLIEYNLIHEVCTDTADAGAVYSGRDWGARGNVFRYNIVRNIKTVGQNHTGVIGLYLDDCDSGHHVYGNIFYDIGNHGVFIGGGRDNIIENNIIARCNRAIHIDRRGPRRIVDNGAAGNYSWNLLEKIQRYNYDQPPWSKRYPKLADILSEGYKQAKEPKGNKALNNILYRNAKNFHDNGQGALKYLQQTNNQLDPTPLFKNEAKFDFQLLNNSPAKQMKDFKEIPLNKIGAHGLIQ